MAKENELYKRLVYQRKEGFDDISESEKSKIFAYCEEYRRFINKAKTEREFCGDAYKLLEENGFVELSRKESLKSGDKVYAVNRGKGIIAAVIGNRPVTEGINIVGSHIDSPRLDLKPNPLYEDNGLGYFKTHYYGGIKKYQWTTIPLSLRGVIVKPDGAQIKISIGENEGDPIFCITDLLPHLAQEQMQRKLSEGVKGEALNVLIGSIKDSDKDVKERIKFNILKLLNEKYDICEEDLTSAELELVPAFEAKDMGLDRSMIAAYGQDDRVCSYGGLRAILDVKHPEKTAVLILTDKEEVGSMGNTGMKSAVFETVIAKIIEKTENKYNELMLKETFLNSVCLSADVCGAFDPIYPEVNEKNNTAYLNCGIGIMKYTGSRGKGGASDASAELVAKIRNIFNKNEVFWQMAELGKVDCGGGGTIAQYVANLNIDVLDCGVPVLSMHSPYEVCGKLDIYMAYKGYHAFFIDSID